MYFETYIFYQNNFPSLFKFIFKALINAAYKGNTEILKSHIEQK